MTNKEIKISLQCWLGKNYLKLFGGSYDASTQLIKDIKESHVVFVVTNSFLDTILAASQNFKKNVQFLPNVQKIQGNSL